MMYFSLLTLLGLSQVLLQCKGKVFSPTNPDMLIFLPGSNARIVWTFDDAIVPASYRLWSFRVGDGSPQTLGTINGGGNFNKLTRMFNVTVVKPATLVLNNVNQTHNGKYKFSLQPTVGGGESEVAVFIATKPNVTVCSSPITVNESQNGSCSCTSEGGNPAANLTWTKNGEKIGETEAKNNTLFLKNVNAEDAGNYVCTAESYPDDEYRDVKSVELIVNYKPNNTSVSFSSNPAVLGENVVVSCMSNAHPTPKYKITHNGTNERLRKEFVIDPVVWNSSGIYKCTAENDLGPNSAQDVLNVVAEAPTTPMTSSTEGTRTGTGLSQSTGQTSMPTTSATEKTTTVPPPPFCDTLCIIFIIVGVLVLILIIVGVVYYRKKRARNGYKGNANVIPDDANVIPDDGNVRKSGVNHYELEDNAYDSVKGDNAYDSVNSPGSSASTSKPPEDTMPPVYAAVDKDNRKGKTLYATLDSVALESDGSQKRKDDRPPPTEYADINFLKKEPDQNAGEAV